MRPRCAGVREVDCSRAAPPGRSGHLNRPGQRPKSGAVPAARPGRQEGWPVEKVSWGARRLGRGLVAWTLHPAPPAPRAWRCPPRASAGPQGAVHCEVFRNPRRLHRPGFLVFLFPPGALRVEERASSARGMGRGPGLSRGDAATAGLAVGTGSQPFILQPRVDHTRLCSSCLHNPISAGTSVSADLDCGICLGSLGSHSPGPGSFPFWQTWLRLHFCFSLLLLFWSKARNHSSLHPEKMSVFID